MSTNDKVKQLSDGYVNAIYDGIIPAKQAIEVRLAFYGGMMAMIGLSAEIANAESSEEDAMKEMAMTYTAIRARALKLNEERFKS